MHHRVHMERSWEFDECGRLLSFIEESVGGYIVAQAMHFGGGRRHCNDPEDAEMLAARMVPRRRVG